MFVWRLLSVVRGPWFDSATLRPSASRIVVRGPLRLSASRSVVRTPNSDYELPILDQ